jgi:D-beta-D-heptose 7-phosphate kinase / D-beta-D-heptose 1-phosphate adenosyltransferase
MIEYSCDTAEMLKLIDKFAGQPVLVLGDVMLDRYWWGDVTRISPEAPVPVVRKASTTLAVGGAANVASNIASLGGVPYLIGAVGDDEAARELRQMLLSKRVTPEQLVVVAGRPTTVKTRIVARHQQVVRVDEEDTSDLPSASVDQLQHSVEKLLPLVRAVIVSDYAKGVLTAALLREVISAARAAGCPVLVDPKSKDFARYNGAAVLTPNELEALIAVGLHTDRTWLAAEIGAALLSQLEVQAVLVTQGGAGMTLIERGQQPLHIQAAARSVYDVTGAGDTVVAALGVTLAAGGSLPAATWIANLAAGLAVEEVGTVAVSQSALREVVMACSSPAALNATWSYLTLNGSRQSD